MVLSFVSGFPLGKMAFFPEESAVFILIFWRFVHMFFGFNCGIIPLVRGLQPGFCGGNVMYQVGELVVYGIHGVCRVADEEKKTIDRKKVTYLVLEPVNQSGSRFLVPTHNANVMAKVRSVLTPEGMEKLLTSREVRGSAWIADEGQRKQLYRELVSSTDAVRLASMVYTLYHHKSAQLAAGKKVHQSDDNFLRDGEKLLINEAAVIFGWDTDQAKQYIRSKLKEDA